MDEGDRVEVLDDMNPHERLSMQRNQEREPKEENILDNLVYGGSA